MSDVQDLTIIIVNWNVKELLRDCLKSVYGQAKTISLEVLVVDNASSDGSIEMVEKEFPQVKLFKNKENVGFAKANNQAIRQSRGKYVLLLNPDTIVLDKAAVKLVQFMDEHIDIGAAGPKIIGSDNNVQLSCGMHFPTPWTELWTFTRLSYIFPKSKIFGRCLMSYWPHNDTREVDVVSGACMMVRREAIEEVGLLDEHFFLIAEETDWCYRMKKAGWKVYLYVNAEIVHFVGQSMQRSLINTNLEGYKSMYLFYRKHYGQVSASSYRAMTFVFVGLRYLLYTVGQYIRPAERARFRGLLESYQQIIAWSIHCR
jgi:GT2 family glycosyltransferase